MKVNFPSSRKVIGSCIICTTCICPKIFYCTVLYMQDIVTVFFFCYMCLLSFVPMQNVTKN
jgi:hypothetical protein